MRSNKMVASVVATAAALLLTIGMGSLGGMGLPVAAAGGPFVANHTTASHQSPLGTAQAVASAATGGGVSTGVTVSEPIPIPTALIAPSSAQSAAIESLVFPAAAAGTYSASATLGGVSTPQRSAEVGSGVATSGFGVSVSCAGCTVLSTKNANALLASTAGGTPVPSATVDLTVTVPAAEDVTVTGTLSAVAGFVGLALGGVRLPIALGSADLTTTGTVSDISLTATAPPPPPPAAITIQNFTFSPTPLTVPVGTTVTATNKDGATHTWTGGAWDSGNLGTGQSFSHTFTTKGSFTYACSIHPFMTGTVDVT